MSWLISLNALLRRHRPSVKIRKSELTKLGRRQKTAVMPVNNVLNWSCVTKVFAEVVVICTGGKSDQSKTD